MITILIPLYNGIEFLEECLKSVVSQTYSEWNVIIGINGHGSDGGDIIQKARAYATDPRISIHIQGPPLKGKVESLNDMMTLVKTEWVCLLDCDDVWLPTKLEEQMNCLKALDYKIDVIGTLCQYFGNRSDSPSIPVGHIEASCLDKANPIINSSSLIRRSHCYWRYTSICHGMEDYDLWMRIAFFGGTLYNIPKVLCYHRIHSTSAFNSQQQSPAALQHEYRRKNATYFTVPGL